MGDTDAESYEIRRALAGDADEMARLGAQLGYPATVADMAERLAALLRNGRHRIAVAASSSLGSHGDRR